MVKNSIECLEIYKANNKIFPNEIIFICRSGGLTSNDAFLGDKFVSPLRMELKEHFEN